MSPDQASGYFDRRTPNTFGMGQGRSLASFSMKPVSPTSTSSPADHRACP